MKRLSIFCIFITLFLTNANSEETFLSDGKTWNYELEEVNVWENTKVTSSLSYVISGEITLDGKTYKKMMRVTTDESCYYCALREEGQRVFIHSDNGDEILLYDFGQKVGETYSLKSPDSNEVMAILELKSLWQKDIHGKTKNVMRYNDVSNKSNVYVIEGVGYTNGWNILDNYTALPTDGIYKIEHFKSCYVGEDLLFSADDVESVQSYAEESYKQFLTEGKIWQYVYHDMNDNTHNKSLTVRGDTLIANINYKRIVDVATGRCECVMREDGSKVYCYQNENEFIVYDFSLNVGDTFETSNVNATVVAVKDILVGGRSFRVLDVRDNDTNISNWWVEGIGGMNYLTNSIRVPGDNYTFLQCQLGEEVLFSQQDFLTLPDLFAQEYFPEGTKWTEIRLDTLKYDSWYSKVGEEWVPNFETVEYRVQGEYTDMDWVYRKVFTNGPTWTDSLALMILEMDNRVLVSVPTHNYLEEFYVPFPGTAYQFDWSVGKGLYYEDILESNTTSEYPYHCYYGIIDEIKEGIFGGVCSLKYVDLNGKAPVNPQEPGNTDTEGGRIIQGIGITEWKSGECLFGPPNPYGALSMFDYGRQDLYPERHYRSMLVHFERNGEVLYDFSPKKGAINGIRNVSKEYTPIDQTYYDLQGRRLTSQPSKGVFIKDGKKVVVK